MEAEAGHPQKNQRMHRLQLGLKKSKLSVQIFFY